MVTRIATGQNEPEADIQQRVISHMFAICLGRDVVLP